MSDSRDTLFRQWTMLQRLPRYPRRIATRDMVAYLEDQGFSVSARTVERDLEKLSAVFGYSSEQDGRRYLWFWPPGFQAIDIPGLDPATALAFRLAETHLRHLLPPSTLELLDPYFRRAAQVLDDSRGTTLAHWGDKVRVLGVGPELRPANVDESVQRTMYDALLNEKRVEIVCAARGRESQKAYRFSPLALVSRQGMIYMVGPFWSYENVVQIALHRICAAENLDERVHVPKGFDIDRYISDQGEFSYPAGLGEIQVELLFDRAAAMHLAERPLGADQRIEAVDDDHVCLRATVLDTDELTWWLLGFNANAEVLKPAALRRRIGAMLREAAARYGN